MNDHLDPQLKYRVPMDVTKFAANRAQITDWCRAGGIAYTIMFGLPGGQLAPILLFETKAAADAVRGRWAKMIA